MNIWQRSLRLWPWLAAIVSGALYAGCFPPFDQGWLCWFALTPLIAAVWFSGVESRHRWLRNLLLGYVAGVVFFTITFSWLGSLGILFENFWLRGLPLLLSLYLGLNLAFWSYFVGLIKPRDFVGSPRNLLAAFLAASAWVAHEWTRGWLFGGFGWNGLGVALHQNWPVIQIAEFTGVIGLSFVIVFVNVIVITTPLRLFREAKTHRMRPHWDINLTMLGVVALLVFGWRAAQNPLPTKPLRVAAVQAAVPQREKFDPRFAADVFDRFRRWSDAAVSAIPPPDLLVWSESSLPDPVRDENSGSYRFVRDFAAATKTDLLLGTIDFEDNRVYNAAALISNGGEQWQMYHKIHLVPFGEYVPLRHSFPPFAAIAGRWIPGDFDVGQDHTVFRLTNADARVAPLICFEDTVGDLTRQFVRQGANLLVNVTNDGWFLHSAGSHQHLANAVFRCAETRCPMVRAANTGVTCFVNEFGRVTQILQDDNGSTFTEGVLTGEINVPQDRQVTFYTRHGDLFAEICAAVSVVALVLGIVRQKKIAAA